MKNYVPCIDYEVLPNTLKNNNATLPFTEVKDDV